MGGSDKFEDRPVEPHSSGTGAFCVGPGFEEEKLFPEIRCIMLGRTGLLGKLQMNVSSVIEANIPAKARGRIVGERLMKKM